VKIDSLGNLRGPQLHRFMPRLHRSFVCITAITPSGRRNSVEGSAADRNRFADGFCGPVNREADVRIGPLRAATWRSVACLCKQRSRALSSL